MKLRYCVCLRFEAGEEVHDDVDWQRNCNLLLCSVWSLCIPDHLQKWFGRSDRNLTSIRLGCIYTCTFTWSNTIWLQSDHPQPIWMPGVHGARDGTEMGLIGEEQNWVWSGRSQSWPTAPTGPPKQSSLLQGYQWTWQIRVDSSTPKGLLSKHYTAKKNKHTHRHRHRERHTDSQPTRVCGKRLPLHALSFSGLKWQH